MPDVLTATERDMIEDYERRKGVRRIPKGVSGLPGYGMVDGKLVTLGKPGKRMTYAQRIRVEAAGKRGKIAIMLNEGRSVAQVSEEMALAESTVIKHAIRAGVSPERLGRPAPEKKKASRKKPKRRTRRSNKGYVSPAVAARRERVVALIKGGATVKAIAGETGMSEATIFGDLRALGLKRGGAKPNATTD